MQVAACKDAPRSVLCRAPESGCSAHAEDLRGCRDEASSLSHVHGDENRDFKIKQTNKNREHVSSKGFSWRDSVFLTFVGCFIHRDVGALSQIWGARACTRIS